MDTRSYRSRNNDTNTNYIIVIFAIGLGYFPGKALIVLCIIRNLPLSKHENNEIVDTCYPEDLYLIEMYYKNNFLVSWIEPNYAEKLKSYNDFSPELFYSLEETILLLYI